MRWAISIFPLKKGGPLDDFFPFFTAYNHMYLLVFATTGLSLDFDSKLWSPESRRGFENQIWPIQPHGSWIFFGFWIQRYFVFVFPHPLFPSIRCILCLSLPNHKMYFVFICLHLLDVFCVRVSPASNHMDFLVEYTPLWVWGVLVIFAGCMRVVLDLKS